MSRTAASIAAMRRNAPRNVDISFILSPEPEVRRTQLESVQAKVGGGIGGGRATLRRSALDIIR
jgi:hypothetical protein